MGLADLIPDENRSPGLKGSELERAQEEAGAAFPPDLAEFLMDCLPVGRRFPDWRNNPAAEMRDWPAEVLHGFVFDVEHNAVWLEEWGARPGDPQEAHARVAEFMADAPRLIRITATAASPMSRSK